MLSSEARFNTHVVEGEAFPIYSYVFFLLLKDIQSTRLIIAKMAEPADTTKTAMEGKPVSSHMEDQVQKLAEKVWSKSLISSPNALVALAPQAVLCA